MIVKLEKITKLNIPISISSIMDSSFITIPKINICQRQLHSARSCFRNYRNPEDILTKTLLEEGRILTNKHRRLISRLAVPSLSPPNNISTNTDSTNSSFPSISVDINYPKLKQHSDCLGSIERKEVTNDPKIENSEPKSPNPQTSYKCVDLNKNKSLAHEIKLKLPKKRSESTSRNLRIYKRMSIIETPVSKTPSRKRPTSNYIDED